MALNSHRNLGLVGNQQRTAASRLSSGFRINSGADDAAGLAISEGMRAQIRGMNQASRNSQDGISLIQTAEGYTQTITELSQRMRTLSIQAANDTNSDLQREFIAGEMGQLMSEIERIWDTATFNGQGVFEGAGTTGLALLAGLDPSNAADAATIFNRTSAATDVRNEALRVQGLIQSERGNIDGIRNFLAAVESFLAPGGLYHGDATATLDDLFDAVANAGGFADADEVEAAWDAIVAVLEDAAFADLNTAIGDLNTANGVAAGQAGFIETINISTGGITNIADGDLDDTVTLNAVAGIVNNMLNRLDAANNAIAGFARGQAPGTDEGILAGDFFLQVGPDGSEPGIGHSLQVSGDGGQLGSTIDNVADGIADVRMALGGSRGQFLVTDDMLLNNHQTFSAFTSTVDSFLNNVNALRAGLGAVQNRLEFTIENLDVAAENLSASESRIRDADMAQEMMRLTQANVLQQAATAMLAQANQAPQSVLQLLG